MLSELIKILSSSIDLKTNAINDGYVNRILNIKTMPLYLNKMIRIKLDDLVYYLKQIGPFLSIGCIRSSSNDSNIIDTNNNVSMCTNFSSRSGYGLGNNFLSSRQESLILININDFLEMIKLVSTEDGVCYILNKFIEEVEKCVSNHRGIVESFYYDEIRISFNTIAKPLDSHQLCAVQTSFNLIKSIDYLNSLFEAELNVALSTRLVIVSEDYLSGICGTNSFRRYSRYGETIKIMKNLNDLNKIFDSIIIVNHEIYESTKDMFKYFQRGWYYFNDQLYGIYSLPIENDNNIDNTNDCLDNICKDPCSPPQCRKDKSKNRKKIYKSYKKFWDRYRNPKTKYDVLIDMYNEWLLEGCYIPDEIKDLIKVIRKYKEDERIVLAYDILNELKMIGVGFEISQLDNY